VPELRVQRGDAELAATFTPGGATALVALHVNVPTLLLSGDDDTWTPVEPSIAAWRRARGDAVDVRVLAGTGHEPLTEDGHVAPAYEQELLSWLAAHAR
jgi:hypothetical protein